MSSFRVRTGIAVLLTAAVAVLGLQAPASAHHKPGHSGGPGSNCSSPQDKYPPGQCNPERASVDDNTLTRGQQFTFSAQGFAPGSLVTIGMCSTGVVLGTAQPDEFTFFSVELTLPATAELGEQCLVATGIGADGAPLSLTVPITVVALGAVGSGPVTEVPDTRTEISFAGVGLPRTGTAVATVALTGLVLVTAGGAVLVASRRRRDEFA